MINQLSPRKTLWIEYALATLAITIPIVMMWVESPFQIKILAGLSYVPLISLPYVFLRKRRRLYALISVWAILLLYVTNLWNFRFFHDLIPFQNYFLFGNFNWDLVEAGATVVKLKDSLMFLPAILLTVAYSFNVFKAARTASFSKVEKWGIAIIAIASALFFDVHRVVQTKRHSRDTLKEIVERRYDIHTATSCGKHEYNTYGLISYIGRNLIRQILYHYTDRTLTDLEKADIDTYNRLHAQLSLMTPDLTDEFIVNRDKNLLFVVVESLNAWAVEYEYQGNRLMPVLSELMKAEGSVSTSQMMSQVHSGQSSDGQFIYNTGFYSASDATTVVKYLDNDLPSMAKILKPRTSFEVICESPTVWLHKQSNEAYGYDHFITHTDKRAEKEGIGRDRAMFRTALEVIDTIAKPYYGMIITMSMHSPYRDNYVSAPSTPKWISEIPDISPERRDYMSVTNYFDTCLGEFIAGLKELGEYDNTVIAIASDHTGPIDKTEEENADCGIVLSIVNAGVTLHADYPIGQVDVFPTLLQIMGRYNENDYKGMGLSMFNPVLRGAIDKFSVIHGDSISEPLDSMLQLSTMTANAMLRAKTYK